MYANHTSLSVLALSSRFDGPYLTVRKQRAKRNLSVLALSSRFDGPVLVTDTGDAAHTFSTRSVESF